jgi:hypothetical protein
VDGIRDDDPDPFIIGFRQADGGEPPVEGVWGNPGPQIVNDMCPEHSKRIHMGH